MHEHTAEWNLFTYAHVKVPEIELTFTPFCSHIGNIAEYRRKILIPNHGATAGGFHR